MSYTKWTYFQTNYLYSNWLKKPLLKKFRFFKQFKSRSYMVGKSAPCNSFFLIFILLVVFTSLKKTFWVQFITSFFQLHFLTLSVIGASFCFFAIWKRLSLYMSMVAKISSQGWFCRCLCLVRSSQGWIVSIPAFVAFPSIVETFDWTWSNFKTILAFFFTSRLNLQ